jgi:UDP-N-acetylmuramate: L-alanyl-gamma-D-glutamyl-meso-diaminopimelate ligase
MHIHILGICGTFMGGLALLARAAGHEVTGSDAHVYPPMSTQLREHGIAVKEGYDPEHLKPAPDCVVVGNALSRGNPAVEYLLDRGLSYTSGPQWLAEHILRDRWVLAVAGTHGKTTTSSLLAWILEDAGLAPGFLIGGVPENFGVSARHGETVFFVVEADEYDTAFFDKRSKFIHYRPRTLILNNLELDHVDIFPDLDAIKTQFHHLIRTVPGNGLIVSNGCDSNLAEVIERGCWTPVEHYAVGETAPAGEWSARSVSADGSSFDVFAGQTYQGSVEWPLLGRHNVENALAAIAGARHAGVPAAHAIAALSRFKGVKRRLEQRGERGGTTVYDDFAHHPTAIATTLAGFRGRVGTARIIAIVEPRSNTMRMGVHKDALAPALAEADLVLLFQPPGLGWDLQPVAAALGPRGRVFDSVQAIIDQVVREAGPGDHIVVMSNGAFEDIHQRLLDSLGDRSLAV